MDYPTEAGWFPKSISRKESANNYESGFFYLDDEDEDDEDEYEDDHDEIRDDEAEYDAANALMDTLIEALVYVARDVFGEDVIINIDVDD